jgi:hypothetical protein
MPDLPHDREILRRLAAETAEIAALPIHREKIALWTRFNRLDWTRPPVWINEICWNEITGPETALQCRDEFCRAWEWRMRETLYQWRHLPVDMVVEPVLWCPLVIHDTGFGLQPTTKRPEGEGMVCVDFIPMLKTEADLKMIRTPEITVDRAASDRQCERLRGLVGDILDVRQIGSTDTWFAPWDMLCMVWGIQELYADMFDRPEFVHMGIGRLVDAMLSRMDQLQAQEALALNNGNFRIGSGGLGYSDELPQKDFDGTHVRFMDRWGSATPQIFSEVSPAMHEEFALRYEMKWLQRCGLNYYGCCEPHHKKVGILSKIPRLRKISMSPFVNVEEGAAGCGTRFIYSHKPNPSVFAQEKWNPEQARSELRSVLERTRGCHVEIILKDISTLRGEPRRLWDWARIAMEESERFAP